VSAKRERLSHKFRSRGSRDGSRMRIMHDDSRDKRRYGMARSQDRPSRGGVGEVEDGRMGMMMKSCGVAVGVRLTM